MAHKSSVLPSGRRTDMKRFFAPATPDQLFVIYTFVRQRAPLLQKQSNNNGRQSFLVECFTTHHKRALSLSLTESRRLKHTHGVHGHTDCQRFLVGTEARAHMNNNFHDIFC